MAIRKIDYIGIIGNADSSIEDITLKHGFKIYNVPMYDLQTVICPLEGLDPEDHRGFFEIINEMTWENSGKLLFIHKKFNIKYKKTDESSIYFEQSLKFQVFKKATTYIPIRHEDVFDFVLYDRVRTYFRNIFK